VILLTGLSSRHSGANNRDTIRSNYVSILPFVSAGDGPTATAVKQSLRLKIARDQIDPAIAMQSTVCYF
jgi:hypothetical protein